MSHCCHCIHVNHPQTHYWIHVSLLTHLSKNSCPFLLLCFSVLSVRALESCLLLLQDSEELKGYLHGMRECRPFFLFLPWEEWEREREKHTKLKSNQGFLFKQSVKTHLAVYALCALLFWYAQLWISLSTLPNSPSFNNSHTKPLSGSLWHMHINSVTPPTFPF